MLLLSRPKPCKYESLRGYILRVSQANYYHTTQLVLESAGLWTGRYYDTASRYIFGNACLQQLATITNTSIKELEALRYGLNKHKKSSILGHQIANEHLRLDHPRVCPDCLSQQNIALAIWDIPAITVCPIHRVQLFDHCPECGVRLRWNRSGIHLCHACKCDYREYTSEKKTLEGYRLSRLIYQLSMNMSVNHKGIPIILRDHSLADVLELCCSVAVLDYQLTPDFLSNSKQLSLKVSPNDLLHTHFNNAIKHLDSWPDNFFQFLSNSRRLRRGRGNTDGISKEIGAPFYHLKANRHKSIYAPLWDAYCDYRDSESRKTATKILKDRAQAEYISIKAAARELRIRPYQLERFIKRLRIKARKEAGSRKLISRNDIQNLRQILSRLLSMTATAQQLGCSVYQLRQLIRSNIITPFRGPAIDKTRDWLFEAEAVDDFQHQVLRKSLTSGFKTTHTLDLNQAHQKIRYYKLGFPDLVQAILTGLVRPARPKPAKGFNGLKFSIRELERLRGDPESNPDYWQPPKIRDHLGCKRYVVFGLMNSGQLLNEKIILPGRNRPVFACKIAAVKAFHKRYILLQDIAAQLGVSTKEAKLLLLYEDIEPVSGPSIDTGHSWLYLRNQVTPALIKKIRRAT